MKKLLFVLALVLPSMLFSQINFSPNFDVELSESYEEVDALVKEYFPVREGKEVLTVKTSKEGVTITLFDVQEMKEIKRKEISDFSKDSKFIDIVYISDEKFFYLFEEYNKSTKLSTVYKRNIAIGSVDLGDKQKLFTSSGQVTDDLKRTYVSLSGSDLNSKGRINKPNFFVTTSFDMSKILITYRLKPLVRADKNNFDVIGMNVFDSDMENVWRKEIKMPYTEAVMNNLAYGVGNQGNSLVLLQKVSDNTLEMISFNEEETTHYEIDVDTDVLFQRFNIHETPEGNFLFSGLYANGVDLNYTVYTDGSGIDYTAHFNSDGLFTFTLASDGELLSYRKIPFEVDFIKKYLNKKQIKKLEKREAKGIAGISDLRIVDTHINADGSKIFLCERQRMGKANNGASDQMVYYYGNIVAIKIDAEGELDWITKLPKQQAGLRGQGGMSFKYIHGKDKHYVVYLDNVKNAELQADDVPAMYEDGKGGILTAYVLDDEQGKVKKEFIFNVKDVNGTKIHKFKVSRIFKVFSGTFFTEVYLKGNKDGMIKISTK